MSAWFDYFMKESLDPVHDAFALWDFMFFGVEDSDEEPTDEECRRAGENALAHLDMMLAANFPSWEMHLGDNRLTLVPAEQAIARWREQLDHALETNEWDDLVLEGMHNGPRVIVIGDDHPLRSTTTPS